MNSKTYWQIISECIMPNLSEKLNNAINAILQRNLPVNISFESFTIDRCIKTENDESLIVSDLKRKRHLIFKPSMFYIEHEINKDDTLNPLLIALRISLERMVSLSDNVEGYCNYSFDCKYEYLSSQINSDSFRKIKEIYPSLSRIDDDHMIFRVLEGTLELY